MQLPPAASLPLRSKLLLLACGNEGVRVWHCWPLSVGTAGQLPDGTAASGSQNQPLHPTEVWQARLTGFALLLAAARGLHGLFLLENVRVVAECHTGAAAVGLQAPLGSILGRRAQLNGLGAALWGRLRDRVRAVEL